MLDFVSTDIAKLHEIVLLLLVEELNDVEQYSVRASACCNESFVFSIFFNETDELKKIIRQYTCIKDQADSRRGTFLFLTSILLIMAIDRVSRNRNGCRNRYTLLYMLRRFYFLLA